MRWRKRGAPRLVVLYTTPGCHLCEDAAQTLRTLGIEFTTVDAANDASRFLRTPVIDVDGVEVSEGPVEAKTLTRLLR